MPASYYHFTTWAGAEEHFFKALTSDEVWQDTKGIHAHTGQSKGCFIPKFVVCLVDIGSYYFIQLYGVTLLDSNFLIFELF